MPLKISEFISELKRWQKLEGDVEIYHEGYAVHERLLSFPVAGLVEKDGKRVLMISSSLLKVKP